MPVAHAVHVHVHGAVGHHPARFGVGVIAHHGDRRVFIGTSLIAVVGRAATEGRRGEGGAGGRSECGEKKYVFGKCVHYVARCLLFS